MIKWDKPCLKISWPNIQISFSSSSWFSSLWFSTDWDCEDCVDCDWAVNGMIERQPNNPTSYQTNIKLIKQSISKRQYMKSSHLPYISHSSLIYHLPSHSSLISYLLLVAYFQFKKYLTKIGRANGPNKRMMIATMRHHVTTYICLPKSK